MFPLVLFLASHLVPQTATDFRQPQLAASEKVVAVAFGSGNRIYFSRSLDQGKTFGDPAVIATVNALMLGNHRGPRIAISAQAIVITAVADGDLLVWRSKDQGVTWTSAKPINDEPKAAREGLHAMAQAPDGTLYAAWLDLRHLRPNQPGTELYGSYSRDGGATWSPNILIYHSPSGSICQCCHPTLLFTKGGELNVMWRNEIGGNRDMYVSHSSDGGRTFSAAEKLGAGSWTLNACPMDGGGMAVSPNGKIITVWRRGMDVFLSPEGGAETQLHEGKNPSIAVNGEGTFVAWSGPDGVQARMPGQDQPVTLDHEGGFVQLMAIPHGPVIAAWERKGTLQFHTLP